MKKGGARMDKTRTRQTERTINSRDHRYARSVANRLKEIFQKNSEESSHSVIQKDKHRKCKNKKGGQMPDQQDQKFDASIRKEDLCSSSLK